MWIGAFLCLLAVVVAVAVVLWPANSAPTPPDFDFEVIVLGSSGGVFESGLSGYMIAANAQTQALIDAGVPSRDSGPLFVSLDAGSLLSGVANQRSAGNLASSVASYDDYVQNARSSGVSPVLAFESWFLRTRIRAFLPSHPHFDHIQALSICSVVDAPLSPASPKPIIALNSTITSLAAHVFNNVMWANLANEGEDALSVYQYIRATPGQVYELPTQNTSSLMSSNAPCALSITTPANTRVSAKAIASSPAFTVEVLPLSHFTSISSVFILQCDNVYVAYFGDTGVRKL